MNGLTNTLDEPHVESVRGIFTRVWIPRLFILAILPSVAMVFAMIFYPESEISKCPLWTDGMPTEVNTHTDVHTHARTNVHTHVHMWGQSFGVSNNTLPGCVGVCVIFLGLVFDVEKNGLQFYGPGNGYSALANGTDATVNIITGSLEVGGTVALSEIPKGQVRKGLLEWLPFFMNKYPQIGVVEGEFWDVSGNPTRLWHEFVNLANDSPLKSPLPIS